MTGTGSGGNIVFKVRFATAAGAATTYSSAGNQSSTLTSAVGSFGTISPGSLTIAAGASTTASTFTATHTGALNGSFTVRFGPYTLSISVRS